MTGTNSISIILALSIICFFSAFVDAQDAPTTDEPTTNESTKTEEETPNLKPYGQGAMNLGVGLGAGGGADVFSLAVSADFAYFVVQRLAPGISISYHATFGDLEYPQSMVVMPYLKFVLIRSFKFAPYLIFGGGRDFQWAGSNNPEKGYPPTKAWLVGGGLGANIGLGDKLALNFQILVLYYHYDEKWILPGQGTEPTDSAVYFPQISLGLAFIL